MKCRMCFRLVWLKQKLLREYVLQNPFQIVSGCPLKGLQCSGFSSGTENTVDRWPRVSSAICSQAVLLYRSGAPGLLLLSSCSPSIFAPFFMMSSDSNPDDIVEYDRAFSAHTVSTVAGILHTEVTDMLDSRCLLPPQLGGLGLIRHAGMSTEKVLSFQRCYIFLLCPSDDL